MIAYTAQGQPIVIDDQDELNRGGEGRIMHLKKPTGKAAKLYFDHVCPLSAAHLNALQVLDSRYFVKPEQLLYADASKHKTIGFIMPLLNNSYYPLSALFSLPFCQKKGITPQKKWDIALQIIEAVADAHRKGIVIGDLSGLNIMCNNQGQLRFIDVDSYQSPAQIHSGILLDEIRDYYYGGNISAQSDWFALAVVLFQLFTYTHPFKGIHKTYTTLQERVIHRIPVFAADPLLTVPKCYIPLQDAFLQQQFNAFFMYGHRSPLQLNGNAAQLAAGHNLRPQLLPHTQLAAGAMHLSHIWESNGSEQLLDAYTCGQYLLLQTDLQYRMYDLSTQGRAQLTAALPANRYEHFWIGNRYAVAVRNNHLYGILPKDGSEYPLKNLHLTSDCRTMQYGNILAIVTPDFIRTAYLDEQNADFIRFDQQSVFGEGIRAGSGGLIQQIGGQTYIWFRAGNVLATALSPLPLQDLFVSENHVLVAYSDNANTAANPALSPQKRLRYTYAGIGNNLQLKIGTQDSDRLKHFAYRPLDKQHGLLFEPADDTLLIRRTEDFQTLQTIDCPILTDETRLFNSAAGLVAVCANAVWLLNKKA